MPLDVPSEARKAEDGYTAYHDDGRHRKHNGFFYFRNKSYAESDNVQALKDVYDDCDPFVMVLSLPQNSALVCQLC